MYLFHELRDRIRRLAGKDRLKNRKVRRAILGGLFFALLTLVLSGQVAPQRLDVKQGDVAPRDVAAPREVLNRVATARLKDMAEKAIIPQEKIDPTVQSDAEKYINEAFTSVAMIRGRPGTDVKVKSQELTVALNMGAAVPPEAITTLLTADEKLLVTARQDAHKLVNLALGNNRVDKTVAAELRDQVEQGREGFTMATKEPWLAIFVKELVKKQVRPNLIPDIEETNRLRKAASLGVEPVLWQKDQIIAKKGDLITEEQYELLKDLRLVGPQAEYPTLIGTALLSAVIVTLMSLYLMRYRPDLLEKDSKLILLGLIGLATLLLSLLMKAFQDNLGAGVGYLMPVAVNAMLVTILLDAKLAFLQSAMLSMLLGLSLPSGQLSHALVAIVGSTVGVYSVSRVESRSDIYRAGLLVSAGNVATIMAVYLIQGYGLLHVPLWKDASLGLANGLIAAVVVTGALPFFENVFGVVTPLKLLELSNPNHPLLKRLLVEAPGSYHHTILVANLCEAAAEAIGADQALVRVGAYYHDIGKVKRPYFFVENQFGGENPHDKLPPSLSSLIVTSHVKDGLEMAREAKLPQEIIDFIPEHHGTSLVSYFYHMASKNGQSEQVIEEDYRYEGPRPRSKETAILMLADGCEASVRAIRARGPLTVDHIEAQVKRIIDDRLKQGQLDDCDLTLRELETIKRTFVKVLSGVHHARIEYPTEAGAGGAPAPTGEPAAAPGEAKADGDLGEQRFRAGAPDGGAGEPGAPGGGESPANGGEPPRG